MSSHQWRLKEHLPLIHDDLVCAGLWSPKEGDVFVLEGLQWLRFTSFIHWHVVSTHTQPQIMRETTLFTLQRQRRQKRRREKGKKDITPLVYFVFFINLWNPSFASLFSHLHIKQSGPISRPLLDNAHVFKHGLMLRHALQPGPLLQDTGPCGGRLLLHPHLQHLLLLHLQQHMSANQWRILCQTINQSGSQSDGNPVCREVHLSFSKPGWFDWADGISAECRDPSRQTCHTHCATTWQRSEATAGKRQLLDRISQDSYDKVV